MLSCKHQSLAVGKQGQHVPFALRKPQGVGNLLAGVVLAVGLAVIADLALLALQRALTPWSRGRTAAA